MSSKVLWLAWWTTAAIWLGGLWGCTGPAPIRYVGEHGTPPAEMSPGGTVPAAAARPPVATVSAGPSLTGLSRAHWAPIVVEPEAAPAAGFPTCFHDVPIAPDDPAPCTSLRNHCRDRQVLNPPVDWPVMVRHMPAAADTRPTGAEPAPPRLATTPEQMNYVLEGARPHTWSGGNVASMFLQPWKMAFDLVVLPYRMYEQTPWAPVTEAGARWEEQPGAR